MNRSTVLVQGLGLGVLYVLFYRSLVPGLVKDWSTYSNFTYGVVVPFISSYLIWHRRTQFQSLPVNPTLLAAIPLSLALGLAVIGEAVGEVFMTRVSMILALGSSIYLLFGKDFVKALVFPLLYLTLMIPFPYIVTNELAHKLRLFDSAYSVAALKIIGIPVYRDSYFLHLPNITLEVADGCSGVSSIFALFAVALIYAYFSPVPWIAKFLVSASAVPIAILANLVRIIVIATLAYYLGPVALNSPIHYWSGVFNFVVGLTFVVLVGELIRKRCSKHPVRMFNKQVGEPTGSARGVWVGWSSFIAGVSIFGLALWFSGNLGAEAKASVKINLEELSSSIAQLYPQTHMLWADPYEDNKADSSFGKIYFGPSQVPVELFIAYRGLQNGANRLQSPKLVFPEGWNFAWVKPTEIEIDGIAKIKANWMLTRKGSSQRLVLYWYQNSEMTFSSELNYRMKLFERQLLGGRTDGAVVRIVTPIRDHEDVEQAQDRLKSLALHLYPRLVQLVAYLR